MKKILIPVDFSEFSDKAVEEGKVMAKAFGSEVVLLHIVGVRMSGRGFGVIDPLPGWNDVIGDSEKSEAEEKLLAYKESFGEMKNKVTTLRMHGAITDEIIKTINDTDVDFVIIGSHGIGSLLSRNILGSVANKVLHHSDKPLLIIR